MVLGYCQAFAGIALPNPASGALYQAVAIAPIGIYRSVGFRAFAFALDPFGCQCADGRIPGHSGASGQQAFARGNRLLGVEMPSPGAGLEPRPQPMQERPSATRATMATSFELLISGHPRSGQHGLNRPPKRGGHGWSATESDYHIRTLSSQSERRGKLRPHRLDFDRLVQKRITDANCRGLERKALVAAAHFDPARLIGGNADEYPNTSRTANLADVLVILTLRFIEPSEGEIAKPRRDIRVARTSGVKTISCTNRSGTVEADPALEFLDKCRIRHLRGVGRVPLPGAR